MNNDSNNKDLTDDTTPRHLAGSPRSGKSVSKAALPVRRLLRTVGLGLVALFLGSLVAALVYVPRSGWSTNDVTTGQHPGYPDLTPRLYDMDVRNTTIFAADALRRIPGGKPLQTHPDEGRVIGEAAVLGTPFVDDVEIAVTAQGDGSRVTIRSHSRVGKGDLGVNAARIRAIQAQMDDKLPQTGR